MNIECVYHGPEEVFVNVDVIHVPFKKVRDGEWIGTEKEWRKFIDDNNLIVETSDEEYAIINNEAVFVGIDYADEFGGRGHFDDEY